MENGVTHKILATNIPWHQRLLTRAILFLIIPCVLPLLLVCGVVLYYVGVDAQKQMESALLLSAATAGRKVEHYFSDLEDDVKFLGARLDHDNLAVPENTLLIAAFAATHNDIETVWLQDKEGEIRVLYSRREMLDRENPPPVDVRALGPSGVGVIWRGTTYNDFGEPIFAGSVSVLHPWEKEAFGSLIFTIRPQYLQEIVIRIDVGKSGTAFLVDSDGKLISHSNRAMAVAGNDMASHPAMHWLQEAGAGDFSPRLAQDPSHLIAYGKIPPAHLGVVVQRDKSEMYDTRNRLAWLVVGSFVILAVLMVPLVIAFSLRMTRPISALLQAMKTFAAEGVLPGRNELADGGELGLLADAFHEMAEQRLSSEKRYREIVDGTDNLIIQVDLEGRFVFVNHIAEKVFGVSLDQLHGRPAFEFVHPEDRPRTQNWFTDCVERRIEQSTIENRQVSRDADLVSHLLWNCHFIYDDSGQLRGVNGIAHNITERRTAEEQKRKMAEQLLQSQKMESIGTLAGGIAHDFNNILAPILGYAELTLLKVPAGPVADSLREIQSAAVRARDLVQQILTFSRRAEHSRKPLLPHPVIKEALKLLRSSLPVTIEIRQDISEECGMILGDPTHLQQIIMNLSTNAYHAMREKGGVLGVTLKKVDIQEKDGKVLGLDLAAGPYVELEVSDTGCGMDRATMAKIFEPYFTTKKMGEGTGLGLAIIHGIVKSYNGHVTVYSEPGQGTTFRVYLPRVDAEQIVVVDRAEQEPLPGGDERLLVVDDEEAITNMLHTVLAGLGYQVTVCNESEEALRLFQELPSDFDLLVTDMTMPHLTGLELSRRVFEIRPDMPVILCTGFSELVSKAKAAQFGFREFLMKPVAVRDLAHAIRRALAKE